MICCFVKCKKLGSNAIAVATVVRGPRVITVISSKNKTNIYNVYIKLLESLYVKLILYIYI